MNSNEPVDPPARPVKRRLSRTRRVFRWSLWIVLALVALGVGLAAAVLWTGYGTRLAVEEALTVVNDSVPGNVEVGSVEGTLADGLVLNDVIIRDPEGKEALRLSRLAVRVGLWDLMGRRVRVEELSLSGLDVALFDRRDRLALARAFITDTVTPAEESDPSTWTIDVESIHLDDVDIVGTEGGPVWVRGLALDAAVLLTPTEMRWRDVTLSGEIVKPPLPLVPTGAFRFTTAGGMEGERLNVERFTAAVGGVALDLSADLPQLGGTAGTITVRGVEADFAALAAWLPASAGLLGKPTLQGEIRSDGERVTAKLSVSAGETSVTIDAAATVFPRLGGWRVRVNGEKLRPDATLASLPGIVAERLALQVDGDGTPLAPNSHVSLQLSAQDLAVPNLPVAQVEADVTIVGSRAFARVDVSGDGLGLASSQIEMADVFGPAVTATVDLRDVDLAALPSTLGLTGLTGLVPQLQLVADVRLVPNAAPVVAGSIIGCLDGVSLPPSFGGHRVGSAIIDADLSYGGAGLPTGEARLSLRDVASGALAASAVVLEVAADTDGAGTRIGVQVTTHGVSGPSGVSLEDGHVTADARLEADGRVASGQVAARAVGVSQGPWHLAGLAFSGRLLPPRDVAGGARFEGPLTLTAATGPDGLGIGEVQGTVGVTLGDRLSRPPGPGPHIESPLGVKGGLHFDAVRLGLGRSLRHLEARVDASWSSQGLGGTLEVGAESLQLSGLSLDDASLVAHLGHDERGRLDVRGRRGNLRAGATVGVGFPKGLAGPVDVQLFEAFARKGAIGFETSGVATLRYDPAGSAAVERLRLKLAGSTGTALSIDGDIALESGQLNVAIAMPKQLVKPWLELGRALAGDPEPLPKVAGTIAVAADLHGTPARLLGDVRVTLSEGRVGRTRGLSGDVVVALGRESATATVAASWGDARLDGKLTAPWPLRDGARTSLTVTSSALELARLGKLVKAARGLRGRVRVEAKAEGAWPRVEGRIDVTGTGVEAPRVAPIDFALAASLEGGVGRGTLRAGAADRLRVELQAPIALDALARGSARLLDANLTGRIDLAPTRVGEFVTGLAGEIANLSAGMALRFSGPLARMRVDGDLSATRGLLSDREVTVTLGPNGDGTRIAAQVGAAGTPLAKATLTFADTVGAAAMAADHRALISSPTTALSVDMDALDHAAIDALVPGLGAQLAALVASPTLKGALRFRGGPGGPSGTAQVELAGAGPGAMLAAATVDVTVTPESTEVRVSAATPPAGTEAKAGVFDVVATIGVGGAMAFGGDTRAISDRSLSGRVRVVALPIAALSALAPGVLGPSEGQVDVDVAIGGSMGRPTLQGDAIAALPRLVVSPLGLDQTDVRVVVSLREDRIRLGPVKLESGPSSLTIDLAAQLAGSSPREIALSGAITLDRYPVLGREDLAARLSGDIGLAGTLAAPAVNARLRLDEVAVRPTTGGRDLEPMTAPDGIVFVGTAVPVASSEAAPELPGIAEGLALDLTIEIPTRAVHVRNDMVDLRASGDLRITSREAALGIVGHVGVDEGRVFVYGREFAISPDSRVIFDGSEQLDPALDVRATFDISGVDLTTLGPNLTGKVITLEVSGNASRPKVALRSDPEMTETNIMSIITLGFPAGGSPGATGAGEDSARIANLVMGLVSASASRMIQDKLPVDVFKIETGSSQLSDTRITVGRRILRNLMVAYHADLGAREGENTNEIRVQYELTRRLHLDGRYGDGRAGALDLFYRWRF